MSNGNENYKFNRAFGTPGAFAPGTIESGIQGSDLNLPYQVVDVNVDLGGAEAGDIFNLGPPIAAGSVLVSASIDGHGTLPGVVVLSLGVAEKLTPASLTYDDYSSLNVFPASATGGVPGVDPNGGFIVLAPTSTVVTPSVPFTPVPGTALPLIVPTLSVDSTAIVTPLPVTTRVSVKMIFQLL